MPDLLRHWTGDEFGTRSTHAPAGVKGRPADQVCQAGSPASNSGPNGDLYILVHVDKHPVFGRDGNNVTV